MDSLRGGALRASTSRSRKLLPTTIRSSSMIYQPRDSSPSSLPIVRLCAFGSNGAGQLGTGIRMDLAEPSDCCFHETAPGNYREFERIVAGGNDTFLHFSDGSVMVAGASANAWIPKGFGSTDGVFLAMSLRESVKLCSATWEAFITLSPSDRIHTFGTGAKGELGRGPDVTAVAYDHALPPLDLSGLIPDGVEVVHLASGLYHTVVVLSDGQVFGWGQGRHGQLGEPAEVVWEPRKIHGISFPVVRAVCGREFTYLVGAPDQGQHIILGTDKWELKTRAPPSVPGWIDIAACGTSILVLDDTGSLKSWGRNDHGQLGPSDLPPIDRIVAGSEHALALTTDGVVLVWGWGEHGNCGEGVDDDGDMKDGCEELAIWMPEHCRVLGIGAGYATSWIWREGEEDEDGDEEHVWVGRTTRPTGSPEG